MASAIVKGAIREFRGSVWWGVLDMVYAYFPSKSICDLCVSSLIVCRRKELEVGLEAALDERISIMNGNWGV